MTYRLVALIFAAALAACTSTGGPTADTTDFDPECERQYSGAAASALANSAQGCAIAPP